MSYAINGKSLIYKQLVDQISAKVKTGELKPGDKLPTERELSLQLNVARGTVKKAYEELEKRNVIKVIHGSGSYICESTEKPEVESENRVDGILDEAICKLQAFGLSAPEIEVLIKSRYSAGEKSQNLVWIAFVDCNLDSLALFKQQLCGIPNKNLSVFLLDNLRMDDNPQKLFADYDLIMTTPSHYDELLTYLPKEKSKIVKAAVSPCQRTIVDIATIGPEASIGLICRNNRFLNIMKDNIASFLSTNNKIISLFEEDYLTMFEAINQVDIIIAAPDSIVFDRNENPHKRIIAFNYQIERGSMIYIEELVKQIYTQKYLPRAF